MQELIVESSGASKEVQFKFPVWLCVAENLRIEYFFTKLFIYFLNKKNVFLNNLVMVQYVFIHKCKILKKYKFYNFTFSYYVEIKRMLL